MPKVEEDEIVESINNLSFRAKREIFQAQVAENISFLSAVEMTHSLNPTFYETVNDDSPQATQTVMGLDGK